MMFFLTDLPTYKGLEWPANLNVYTKTLLNELTRPPKDWERQQEHPGMYISHMNRGTTKQAYRTLLRLEWIEDTTQPDDIDGRWFNVTALGREIAQAMRFAGEL